MAKQKKLVLVNPLSTFHGYFSRYSAFRCMPLSLAIIAALTPKNWQVKIIDETVSPCSFEKADLVGITSFTSTAPRAYEIATIYHSMHIPVVIGGVHASVCTEEAQMFSDSVVVGNADDTWPRLICDFENNSLKPKYTSTNSSTMLDYPLPRNDLILDKYGIQLIQTSTGCPNNCDFCVVSSLYGKAFRRRNIGEVIKELQSVKTRSLFIADENFIGMTHEHRDTAVAICKEMIKAKVKKEWTFQASVNVGDDDELLFYAKKAGCRSILIGFESLDSESLSSVNKRANLSRVSDGYSRTIKNIHRNGMAVYGMFMCGFDMDDPKSIMDRAKKIVSSKIDCYQFSVITPCPGTRFYEKLKKDNRLLLTNFPQDWAYYDGFHPVFKPQNCTHEELLTSLKKAHSLLYGSRAILSKTIKTILSTKSWGAVVDALSLNVGYRYFVGQVDSRIQTNRQMTYSSENVSGSLVCEPAST